MNYLKPARGACPYAGVGWLGERHEGSIRPSSDLIPQGLEAKDQFLLILAAATLTFAGV